MKCEDEARAIVMDWLTFSAGASMVQADAIESLVRRIEVALASRTNKSSYSTKPMRADNA